MAAVDLGDRYTGCLLGLALGDALGRPLEFLDDDLIRSQYGVEGLLEPPDPALVSDDTQLMLATAEGLLVAEGGPVNQVVSCVTERYLEWLRLQDSPVHRRAPGVATMDALQRLARGYSATVAADAGPNDSITATRSVPCALRYHGDVPHIVSVASEVSRLTHANPAAVVGGAASALLVEYALSGLDPSEWSRKAVLQLKRWGTDDAHVVAEAFHLLDQCLDWPEEDAVETLGRARSGFGAGWTAEEAVTLGLWYFLRHQDSFAAAVVDAANAPGDSDADGVAAIAGALAGAWLGAAALPAAWIGRLEGADYVRGVARGLLQAAGPSGSA